MHTKYKKVLYFLSGKNNEKIKPNYKKVRK